MSGLLGQRQGSHQQRVLFQGRLARHGCDLIVSDCGLSLQFRRQSAADITDYTSAEDRTYVVGDLVLVYNTRFSADGTANRKLAFRWLGPCCVRENNISKGTYTLKKLDGVQLRGTYVGRRLKSSHPRETGTPETSFEGSVDEEDRPVLDNLDPDPA